MGGQGSGGSRSGSGRKKKGKHLRLVDGGADRRGPRPDGDANTAIAESPVLEPPADLLPDELAVWNEWAPLAIAERTLTPATLASFVHLCQMEVDRRALRARYLPRHGGRGELLALLVMGSDEELSVRREHRTLLKDIKGAMKDFLLAPFGKEILTPGEHGAGEVDPLDAFTGKRG